MATNGRDPRDKGERIVLTNMCMICDGAGRILVEERRSQSYPGVAFPGGHIEAGESFYEACIREVREETGLMPIEPRLCGIYHWMLEEDLRYLVLIHRADRYEGELHSSEEGRVFWVPEEEFLGLDLAGGMAEVYRIATEEGLSEDFPYWGAQEGRFIDRLF